MVMREPVARRGKEIQVGDIICDGLGAQRDVIEHEVVEVSKRGKHYRHIRLNLKNGGTIDCLPEAVVGLLYRAWPPGKTNSDMLQALVVAAEEVSALRG